MKIRTQLQLLVIFEKSQLQEINSQLQLHKSQLLEVQLHKKFDSRSGCRGCAGASENLETGKIWKKWKNLEVGKNWKNWKNLGFRLPQSKFDKRKREDF